MSVTNTAAAGGLTDEQIRIRRTGLTATDMVTLAGCDGGFGSPLEIYLSKVENAPSKDSTIRMKAGHAMEPLIVELVAEKYQLELEPGLTMRHPIMDWVLATPDRLVKREPSLVECKLVGYRMVPRWHDEDGVVVFPDSVAVQTAWQMGTTGRRRAYVGALLGDFGEEAFHGAIVEWNEDLWLNLLELGERWWVDHVVAKKAPEPDGSAAAERALKQLYPAIKRPHLLPASAETEALAHLYLDALEAKSKAEAVQKECGNRLRAIIGDAEGVRGADLKATWTPQRGKVSASALCAHFKIPEAEQDQFRGEASRVLRVAPLSKKEKAYRDGSAGLAAE